MLRSIVALLVVVLIAACDDRRPDIVQVDENDVEMEAAILEARRTLPEFLAAVADPKPEWDGFSIKKGFDTRDGGREFIWLTNTTWDGAVLHSVVDSHPADVEGLRSGQAITVKPDEVADWMYRERREPDDANDVLTHVLRGGFTIRVLHFRETPRKQRESSESMGLLIER